MKIIFYKTQAGRVPVLDFLKKLKLDERTVVLACFKSIEDLGFDCPRVQFRQIKGKLWEIKISRYRVFYAIIKREVLMLLHAYKKQSQKAPNKEINVADKRLLEVQNESSYIN